MKRLVTEALIALIMLLSLVKLIQDPDKLSGVVLAIATGIIAGYLVRNAVP